MDYLTTNWRDKMQTNPVANMILNNPKGRTKIGYVGKIKGLTVLPAGVVKPNHFVEYSGDPMIAILDEFEINHPDDFMIAASKKKYPTQTELMNAYNRIKEANPNMKWEDYQEEKYKDGRWIEISDVWAKKNMWNKTFVNDYINIEHPKRRVHLIDAISSKPLQIKPPSVFFSDV